MVVWVSALTFGASIAILASSLGWLVAKALRCPRPEYAPPGSWLIYSTIGNPENLDTAQIATFPKLARTGSHSPFCPLCFYKALILLMVDGSIAGSRPMIYKAGAEVLGLRRILEQSGGD